MLRFAGWILFSALLSALGLAGGWYARSQTDAGGATAPAAAEAVAQDPGFSEHALSNMGVRWGPVEAADFVVTREVPAVVDDLPASLRPVTARWGGTVVSAPLGRTGDVGETVPEAAAGRRVAPGDPLLVLLRAPLPMIDRGLTGDVVQTVSEAVHEAAAELRSARRSLEVAELEWNRVKDLNAGAEEDLPVIPRQTEINLRYEVLKARGEVERVEARLYQHGLSEEQIADAAQGAPVPPTPALWHRALVRNGLWPDLGDAVLQILPAALRAHPWTYAGLGELNALGRCDEALLAALTEIPGLGARFHELVALVQQGHSLEDVCDMHRLGFLDPRIVLRAPPGPPFWRVRHLAVRPGEVVEAGTVLVELTDSRRMILEIEAAGADAALVERALEEGTPLRARPLVAGAGPALDGVVLSAYRSDAGDRPGACAYAVIANEPLPLAGGEEWSAWRLRAGVRYRVGIPVRTVPGGIVLPRAALVKEGADRLVFLRSGTTFKTQTVHVVHEDSENAVVAGDGSLFPGDPVVLSGAFALSLALRAAGGAEEAGEHKHGAT